MRPLDLFAAAWLAFGLTSCSKGPATDPRYPPRPEGCDVKMFHGKPTGGPYDDIGHVDSICSIDLGADACTTELKNQTCKLGGDLVYDVPYEPLKPSPDKLRLTGHVAHSRIVPAK